MSAKDLNAPWIKPLRVEGLYRTEQIPETGEDYEDLNLELGSLESLETRKCRFFDARIGIQTAVEWVATESVFRNCLIEAGRVGSLDLTGVTLNVVTFQGIKAGHASYVNGKLNDVLFQDCHFGSLDLFAVKAKRVKFANCTVDELDLRNFEADNVDLRGLDFASIRGIQFMRGATISETQLMLISAELAKGAGIWVE